MPPRKAEPPFERWALVGIDEVEAREWGGDVVVYDAAAAATHLLNALSGGVVLALLEARRPLTVNELARRVLGGDGDAALAGADGNAAAEIEGNAGVAGNIDPDERGALVVWLADLERIGLATRVPP